MNKNQVVRGGVYEYQETKGSKSVFVTITQIGLEILVYFGNNIGVNIQNIPDTAVFSKWI